MRVSHYTKIHLFPLNTRPCVARFDRSRERLLFTAYDDISWRDDFQLRIWRRASGVVSWGMRSARYVYAWKYIEKLQNMKIINPFGSERSLARRENIQSEPFRRRRRCFYVQKLIKHTRAPFVMKFMFSLAWIWIEQNTDSRRIKRRRSDVWWKMKSENK